MAKTVWTSQTLSADADLVIYEPNIASWGVSSLANKHTLAKNELARMLRLRLSEYKTTVNSKEDREDGVTIATDKTFASALALFSTHKVAAGDRIWIESGSDEGVHVIESVTSNTSIELTVALTASATAVPYHVEPEVLDMIKNPLIMAPAACMLAIYYACEELAPNGDFWEGKRSWYWDKFKTTYEQLAPDLLIDLDQDDVITSAERAMGITSGQLLR